MTPRGNYDNFKGYTFKQREDLFWRTTKRLKTGCVLWTGSVDKDGYGKVTFNYRSVRAHRLSFFFAKGRWPINLLCHRCDNPRCVNVAHLFEGSPLTNRRDCAEKGRTARGTRAPRSKLLPKQVRRIRKLLQKGLSDREIGSLFGVHPATIYGIKSGINWKWLK